MGLLRKCEEKRYKQVALSGQSESRNGFAHLEAAKKIRPGPLADLPMYRSLAVSWSMYFRQPRDGSEGLAEFVPGSTLK